MVDSKLKLIILLSITLRVAAAFYLDDEVVNLPGTADQISYHTLALRVLDGHGFTFGQAWWPVTAANEPTAHWSYLYTIYLAAVYTIFGPHPLAARLIQAIMVGALQPYLIYRIAIQTFGTHPISESSFQGRVVNRSTEKNVTGEFPHLPASIVHKIPLLAAGITAIYVYFAYYAAALMTESFFIVALLGSITLTIDLTRCTTNSQCRNMAIASGLAISITVFLRQLFLLFVPFLLLWLILSTYKRYAWSQLALAVFIPIVVVILAILPVTIYNYTRFERFVLLNTNAGYVLFWGNHPIHGTRFIDASEMGETYQKLVPSELRHLDEAALDQALLKRGVQFILDDPERYVYLSLSRIPAYFKFWPDPDSGKVSNVARVSSFGVFLPFILYGLFRLSFNTRYSTPATFFVQPPFSVILLYLFVVIYTAVHLLTWALIRYRLPVDAVLLIFAALAIADLSQSMLNLVQRFKQDKSKTIANKPVTMHEV